MHKIGGVCVESWKLNTRLTKEFEAKKAVLSSIPDGQLLAIGLPQIEFYNLSGMLYALCPFHGDKHLGSFKYNEQTHCWKCFSCGEGGSGAYSLIMRVNDWNFIKTINYLYEHRNDPVGKFSSSPPPSLIQRGKKIPVSNWQSHSLNRVVERGSDKESAKFMAAHKEISKEDLDQIYRAFADSSPMTGQERQALQYKRGLTYTSTRDFFRFPSPADNDFWMRFRSELRNHDKADGQERLYYSLLSVPGFYWDVQANRPGFISSKCGIGILLHDVKGLVCGIEIRTKNEGFGRYIGFSSGSICLRNPGQFSHGTKLDAPIDVVPKAYPNRPNKGIAVTEGKFKAIHLSYAGYTVLNVRGITNWRRALPILKELAPVSSVAIAFDADAKTNYAVAKCSVELARALMAEEYETQFLAWPLKYGKGYDDLCRNGKENKSLLVDADRYIETTLVPCLNKRNPQLNAS